MQNNYIERKVARAVCAMFISTLALALVNMQTEMCTTLPNNMSHTSTAWQFQ